MENICKPPSPPPPLWTILWATIPAVPAISWILLIVGIVLCIACIRHDWSRLLPDRRWRVSVLCVLTFIALFGGAFFLVLVAGSLSTAASIWYYPATDQLEANNCSTTALDAMYQQFRTVIWWLMGLSICVIGLSWVLSRIWQRARRRYLLTSNGGQ